MDSSSEVCEQEEGSTSLTPESAGLGGKEPEISNVVYILFFPKLTHLCHKRMGLGRHLIEIQ